MGQKQNKKSKNINNKIQNNGSFEEQKLFEAFQEKKIKSEICAITYFKFDSDDIIENKIEESKNMSIIENSLEITIDSSLIDNHKKKKKKKIQKLIYL